MEKSYIVQVVRTPLGGIRKHILSIIEILLEQNNCNLILITNEEDSDIHYKEFKAKYNKNILYYNIPIVDQPGISDLTNILKIFKILKNKKITVIHGHGAKGGLYARLIGVIHKSKVFYTSHGGSLHKMHGKLKNKIYQFIEMFLYFFTTKLLFESNYSMNQYIKYVHKKTNKFLLNYNSIEFPVDFKNTKLKNIQIDKLINISAFGLLREIKGHTELIRAVKLLKNKSIDLKLNIYGDGPEKSNLINLVQELHLQENVEIHGYTEKVQEKMIASDIIVHPSFFESFGYVPLESLTLGIPTVSSLNGGLKEVMIEGNISYNINEVTPENISEAIYNTIYNQDENSKQFDLNKIELQKRFDQENFRKIILKEYF